MNLTELEILFHQKVGEVHPRFREEDRPESFVIANYLNKAIRELIQQKLVNLRSYEERIVAVDEHQDIFSDLIIPSKLLTNPKAIANYNWTGRGNRYQVPSDMLVPLSVSCTHSRTEIYPFSDQKVFARFVSRRQAERIISTPGDKAIMIEPLAFIDDGYFLVIIGDAYTTKIENPYLTYLKEPFTLSHSFTVLTSSTSTLSISAITNGSYFIMRSTGTYVDATGVSANYEPGDKVLKVSGYNTITEIDSDKDIEVGYPYGETNIPEFPEYVHETIIDRALQMFLEEGYLKLVSKEKTQ